MKQDDSAKTTRMELAKAFIENLPFEECHIDLLPAVAKYVETGDESEFKSFTEFQLLQTAARKEKDVENAKKKIAKLEEYQKEFQRFFDEYQKWYEDMFKVDNMGLTKYQKLLIAGEPVDFRGPDLPDDFDLDRDDR